MRSTARGARTERCSGTIRRIDRTARSKEGDRMSLGGLSMARLDRLRDVLAGHVERGDVPGLVAVVARHGYVHLDALGTLAAGGERGPVGRDSIFRISSMTKPVTAVATMILVEECAVRLDEPVDRLLPELAGRQVLASVDGPLDDTVRAKRPITVRDLLTFRQGFGDLMVAPDAYPILVEAAERRLGLGPPHPTQFPGPDEWLRRLGELPLMYQPGERWLYNTGSEILGVLVARASGQPFETFLRERIFEPLHMVDTGFHVPAEKQDRFATGYATDFTTRETYVSDEPATGEWSAPPPFPSGASGLVSTADDYAAFARMLLGGGRLGDVRILSRPSVELLATDHLTPAQKAVSGLLPNYFDTHGWGFGVAVSTRRDDYGSSVGSYGWDGGLGSTWRNDPSEDMVTILLTQRAWTSPNPPQVCRDFWTSAYAAIDD
jgi:CubicO group peptidase (beta-lactamase class C family)